MKGRQDIILYFLLSSGCILGALNPSFHLLHLVTKPSLTIFLMVLVLLAKRWKKPSMKALVLAALGFSLLGDVLLMVDEERELFVFGLASFLLAHICYIITFLITPRIPLEIPFLKRNPWAIFLISALVGWYFTELRDGTGDLAGPVLVYSLVIGLMLLMALNREKHVNAKSFQLVLFGAILFVLSDGVLSWNKFIYPVSYSPLWILGTYAWAQFLIIRGLLKAEVHP